MWICHFFISLIRLSFGTLMYVWMDKVLLAERKYYWYNVFFVVLTPCSTIDIKRAQFILEVLYINLNNLCPVMVTACFCTECHYLLCIDGKLMSLLTLLPEKKRVACQLNRCVFVEHKCFRQHNECTFKTVCVDVFKWLALISISSEIRWQMHGPRNFKGFNDGYSIQSISITMTS